MKICLILFATLALASCGGGSSSVTPTQSTAPTEDTAWAALEARPLKLPDVAEGECPVAAAHELSPEFAVGLGDGPLYPVGLGETGIGSFPVGGEWLGGKVLWVAAPGFGGRALIRGGRLDAPGEVRFGGALIPDTSLTVDTSLPGAYSVTPEGNRVSDWTEWPSYTRVIGAGCYAYQVDTADFSYTIIFKAEL